tara:strand:- start:278 stop:487 length:210 start_codon:yes stop_codon:yes gene_type:complete
METVTQDIGFQLMPLRSSVFDLVRLNLEMTKLASASDPEVGRPLMADCNQKPGAEIDPKLSVIALECRP